MKVAVFSARSYDIDSLTRSNKGQFELVFHDTRLSLESIALTEGCQAICAFVNDRLDRPVLELLANRGIKAIALRCAGFNHVDIQAAKELGIQVARVPAYSPNAVAEHAVALILGLNRKTHRAYQRVRDGNFSLDGLIGFDLVGKTVGVIGTGKIGRVFAGIMAGFGCDVICSDPFPTDGLKYVSIEGLVCESDIVSLHCPLTPEAKHLVNAERIEAMKPGVMLINTSRGGLVDTRAAIEALKSGQIGSLGLDVYEEEASLFFEDKSDEVIQDDIFSRLLTFPNVLITGHQGFLTHEALTNIAETTIKNLVGCLLGGVESHLV
jgi:D-lactate dehydrogenase